MKRLLSFLVSLLVAAPAVAQVSPDPAFVTYAHQRWAELKVQEQINALPAEATREQLGHVASEALFTIVGEWHHTFGHTEVGLYPKLHGTNHRGFGEDIVLIKRGANVYWKDVGGCFGCRTPSLQFDTFLLSDQPDKFAVPPRPNGAPTPVPTPATCEDATRGLLACEAERRTLQAQKADVELRLRDITEQRDTAGLKVEALMDERATLLHEIDVLRGKLQTVTCEAKLLGVIKVPCKVRVP